MKRTATTIVLLSLLSTALFGFFDLEGKVDSASLVTLFGRSISARVEAQINLHEEFSLMVPLEATFEKGRGEPIFLETGLFLAYHPFVQAATIYASLVQVGILFDRPYEEISTYFLNEVSFGYTFGFPFGLVIEPRLTIKDPNSVFVSDYEELKERFTSYPMFRFALYLGWSFDVPKSLSEKRSMR